MNHILSRPAEAALIGAGSSDQPSCSIDFRLERMSNHDWQISAVSPQARAGCVMNSAVPLHNASTTSYTQMHSARIPL